jgi:hypothetical protein
MLNPDHRVDTSKSRIAFLLHAYRQNNNPRDIASHLFESTYGAERVIASWPSSDVKLLWYVFQYSKNRAPFDRLVPLCCDRFAKSVPDRAIDTRAPWERLGRQTLVQKWTGKSADTLACLCGAKHFDLTISENRSAFAPRTLTCPKCLRTVWKHQGFQV